MEQHSVPRNISGFQFHLIGDMTLRQFGYIATAAISAFLIFKVAPLPAIIKYPLMGLVGLSGFAFAFLPIQERPLDRWIVAFIKSVFSPTQYLWLKEGIVPEVLTRPSNVYTKIIPQAHQANHNDAREKLRTYLASLPTQPNQILNQQEKTYIDKTLLLFNTSVVSVNSSINTNLTTPILETKFTPTPVNQNTPKTTSPPPVTPPQTAHQEQPVAPTPEHLKLQAQLAELSSQKEDLARQLASLRQELKTTTQKVVTPSQSHDTEKEMTVKTVSPKNLVEEIGLMNIPQTPNIVIGVIKDGQKRLLPNIIITIKDPQGVPLRAIKTNKLGQFITATPLPNGTYLLEIEDPLKRYSFDLIQITVNGKVFSPIEIIAKGEKEIMREKLAKELFGGANI